MLGMGVPGLLSRPCQSFGCTLVAMIRTITSGSGRTSLKVRLDHQSVLKSKQAKASVALPVRACKVCTLLAWEASMTALQHIAKETCWDAPPVGMKQTFRDAISA